MSSKVLCHGENSGIADILTSGGNGSYTYDWAGFSTASESNKFYKKKIKTDIQNRLNNKLSSLVV